MLWFVNRNGASIPSSSDLAEEEESEDQYNLYLHSESSGENQLDSSRTQYMTYTVAFKCIGSVHDPSAQNVLCHGSWMSRENHIGQMKILDDSDIQ